MGRNVTLPAVDEDAVRQSGFWGLADRFEAAARADMTAELARLWPGLCAAAATGNAQIDAQRWRFLEVLANHNGFSLPTPRPVSPEPRPAGGWAGADDGGGADLPPIAADGLPGISLVTCSMNRTENLLRSLESWVACPEIDEILVVDWSSDAPVAEAIRTAGFLDRRIRVVRVEDEPRWILSYAFNTGFRLARHARILKADADIVLDRAFFRRTPLDPGSFVAGNWRRAGEGQVYVNGFFYLHRADLAAVGGFNEYIRTYGWDDDDLYTRLERRGVARADVDHTLIHHLPHSDAARTGEAEAAGRPAAGEELRRSTLFMIRRNRFLANVLPVWEGHSPALPLVFLAPRDGVERLRRKGAEPCPVPEHIFADAGHYAQREMTAWRLGPRVWELTRAQLDRLLARPFAELDREDVETALAAPAPSGTPAAAMLAPRRARIFVDGQHGLGNRLRAIGSAASIAEATGRELVIVWQPDEHCDCRFSELFDYDGAVLDASFLHDAGHCDIHNYMAIEGGEKDALIRAEGSRDLYVRSAFVLNSPHSDWAGESRFIRSLRPVEAVRALVAAVRHPNDVAAHVRMVGGRKYEHLPHESAEHWTEQDHDLVDHWRTKSHFSHFLARIDALIADGRAGSIFLAADLPETYAAFRECYGDRLAWLERSHYDRSAEQLRYALADAILLSRAPLLLGSTWSSFSELAMRLSPGKIAVEMSGRDF